MKAILLGAMLSMFFCVSDLQAQYSVLEIINATGGTCNGRVSISVDPAGTPHTFVWNDGSISQNLDQICPGIYSVTITTVQGCEWYLEAEVDGIGGCYLPSMTIDADIVSSCGPQSLGSISLRIPNPSKYSYSWSNGGSVTHILTNVGVGDYCVEISKPNGSCSTNRCYSVTANGCGGGGHAGTGALMVNEVSNGVSGTDEEFVELVVVGGDDCGVVDISGYIINDNDGTFTAGGATGSGISPGHIRFAVGEIWSAVPRGAIILIYNDQAKSRSITLGDDPYDSNQDKVYVIPANHAVLQTYNISRGSQLGGQGSYINGGNWSTIALYDIADAMQVRTPQNAYTHGFSYGLPVTMNGGPDDLLLWPMNAIEKAFCFSDGDYRTAGNWMVVDISHGHESPGFPNNTQNQNFINSLCIGGQADDFANSETNPAYEEATVRFSPNPFNNHLNIEVNWNLNEEVQLRVYDLLGRLIINKPLKVLKGYNQFRLEFPFDLPSGLYHMAICREENILFQEKIICTKTGE